MRERYRTEEGHMPSLAFKFSCDREYIDPTTGILYPNGYSWWNPSIMGVSAIPFPVLLKNGGIESWNIDLSGVYFDEQYRYGYSNEYMLDDPSVTEAGLFKEVDHYKLEIGKRILDFKNCSDQVILSNMAIPGYTPWRITYDRLPLLAVCTSLLNAGIPSQLYGWEHPDNIRGCTDVAYRSMRPSSAELADDANLLLFLAELKDFRELAHLCRHRAKLVDTLRGLGDWAGLTPAQFLKKAAKLSSEARLTAEFAIKPFISDVKALFSAFSKLDDRLRAWNKLAASGKYQTRHYDMTPLLLNAYSWPEPHQQVGGILNIYSTVNFKSYATLRFKALPIDASRWSGMNRYFDAIGGGKPASLVWELIPFSFLVDYVVNVQDFVEQFDYSFVDLPIGNEQFGYSLKWTIDQVAEARIFASYAKCDAHMSKYVRRKLPIPNWELEPWRRVPFDVLHLKLPNIEQLKNILALLVARLT